MGKNKNNRTKYGMNHAKVIYNSPSKDKIGQINVTVSEKSLGQLYLSQAKLVRNPFIIMDASEEFKKDVEDGTISDDVFLTINHDERYNNNASEANICYEYHPNIKESSNMRYVRASSGVVPGIYLDKIVQSVENKDNDYIIPYDYILISRTDGTQFMIAENFVSELEDPDLHRYSVIRYVNPREGFKEENIYSEGIDLSRILSGDQAYTNMFAEVFLSEKRLNEILMPVDKVIDFHSSDEVDHGGQYAGYMDSKSLLVSATKEISGIREFEKSPKIKGEKKAENSLIVYSNKPIDLIFRELRKLKELGARVVGAFKRDKGTKMDAQMQHNLEQDPITVPKDELKDEPKDKSLENTAELTITNGEISAADIINAVETNKRKEALKNAINIKEMAKAAKEREEKNK